MTYLFHYINCFPKCKNLLEYHISLNFICSYFDNMGNSDGVVFFLFLRIASEGLRIRFILSVFQSRTKFAGFQK